MYRKMLSRNFTKILARMCDRPLGFQKITLLSVCALFGAKPFHNDVFLKFHIHVLLMEKNKCSEIFHIK